MRAYTVATVARVLGVTRKWLDNALSHHRVEGVVQSRQGVSRKLSPKAVQTLFIAVRLSQEIGVPLERALRLAAELTRDGDPGRRALSGGLGITLDVDRLTEEISVRLAHAVEITPLPRRGRPLVK